MGIAERLKELRISAGVTQKELASSTGIALQSIINYENGRREPNSKAMAALERYFRVSGEFLRGESDERTSEYVWEDAEIMAAVRQSLPKQLNDLNDILKGCSAEEQKLTFDILLQLRLVLLLENDLKKRTALSMIHEVAAAVEHLTSDLPKSEK